MIEFSHVQKNTVNISSWIKLVSQSNGVKQLPLSGSPVREKVFVYDI